MDIPMCFLCRKYLITLTYPFRAKGYNLNLIFVY